MTNNCECIRVHTDHICVCVFVCASTCALGHIVAAFGLLLWQLN